VGMMWMMETTDLVLMVQVQVPRLLLPLSMMSTISTMPSMLSSLSPSSLWSLSSLLL